MNLKYIKKNKNVDNKDTLIEDIYTCIAGEVADDEKHLAIVITFLIIR